MRDPALFLFDEPLSNLDAKLRVQMRTEIKSLHQRLGNTLIYVTLDQIEAMTLADRIVVMQADRIEQHGRPPDLYERPANAFVGGFLGSPAMNFIKGRLVEDTLIATDGTVLPAPLNGKGDSEAGKCSGERAQSRSFPHPTGLKARSKSLSPQGRTRNCW